MKNKILLFIVISIFGSGLATMAHLPNDTAIHSAQHFMRQQSTFSFMENKGQIRDQNQQSNSAVLYQMALPGLNVSLKKNGFSYDAWMTEDLGVDQHLKSIHGLDNKTKPHKYNFSFHRVDVDLLGTNSNSRIEAFGKATDYMMYYTTGTPEEGVKVYHYEKIVYYNLYSGIDLEFVAAPGTNKPVEYNFIVHAGADLAQIKMRYTGALESALKNGTLVMQLAHTKLTESIPASWIHETKQQVQINYRELAHDIKSITIGFTNYNSNGNNTLIIDPTPNLDWGTYYGGLNHDQGWGIDADASGNILVTGFASSSAGVATTGAHQATVGGNNDAFIAKFNAAGIHQWGTYYGGVGDDRGYGIVIDTLDNILVSGITNSSFGFATAGAHQTTIGGDFDAFIAKFNASGVRQWGTYYGGTSADGGYAICSDTSGNVLVSGITLSTNSIATPGAHQTTLGGLADFFILNLNASGTRQWCTYYGGGEDEWSIGIATDVSGNVLVAGNTESFNGISTIGAHQTTNMGGDFFGDGFIAKFNASGVRQWGTYYGGSEDEYSLGIAIDGSGNILVNGRTESFTGISTVGAHQTIFGGFSDGFIVKLDSSGIRQWATYYGGSGEDGGPGIVTDASGNVFVTGMASSATGIVTPNAHQLNYGGLGDCFVMKFNPSGVRQWGTLYGGNTTDIGMDIIIDASGSVFVVGVTSSNSGIATLGAHQTTIVGQDVFIARFSSTNVGINDIANEHLISLFPNPTQRVIYLKADAKFLGSVYVVYDYIGKSVLSGSINAELTSIDLGDLSGGIYMVNIGEMMKQTFKVIKE